MPIGTELCQFWGVPGFSLVTLDDLRLLRDTPIDTFENLNLKAVEPQLQGVAKLLAKAWDDPKFANKMFLRHVTLSEEAIQANTKDASSSGEKSASSEKSTSITRTLLAPRFRAGEADAV